MEQKGLSMSPIVGDIERRLTGEPERIVSKEDIEMADICGISLDELYEGDYKTCSICLLPYTGHGHNARPVNDGICCAACDQSHVMAARLATMGAREDEIEPMLELMRHANALHAQLAEFLQRTGEELSPFSMRRFYQQYGSQDQEQTDSD